MVVNQTPANAEDRTELFYAVFLAQGGDKFQGLLASDISKAVAFLISPCPSQAAEPVLQADECTAALA
jgi:hypothetical protein